MTQQLQRNTAVDVQRVTQTIALLAQEASIELNVQDLRRLPASRAFLPRGKRIYISHLPRQTFQQTLAACAEVSKAGFDPIPHVPVRLLDSHTTLDRLLDEAVRHSGVNEILLIAGDYREPLGPYATVADVLRSGSLNAHGLGRVSLAGHPEGHPKISIEEIRSAEAEKAALAAAAGLRTTFVTQFFFEAKPYRDWVESSRAAGVRARLIGGLSGPASIATLFKFAMRCGVGPSIRALGARPTSFTRLIGEYSPDKVMRELAAARSCDASDFDGVHLFCFGGYLRTCEWLHGVANAHFRLGEQGGFEATQ
ncbi:MAG: methylenetetrahydrofolate reductase [Steroidobacter sp.]